MGLSCVLWNYIVLLSQKWGLTMQCFLLCRRYIEENLNFTGLIVFMSFVYFYQLAWKAHWKDNDNKPPCSRLFRRQVEPQWCRWYVQIMGNWLKTFPTMCPEDSNCIIALGVIFTSKKMINQFNVLRGSILWKNLIDLLLMNDHILW